MLAKSPGLSARAHEVQRADLIFPACRASGLGAEDLGAILVAFSKWIL